MNRSPIIVALDFFESKQALNLAQQLDPSVCRLKVGKELFTSVGPQLVETVQNLGFEVFLDLKFHDIPHTVAGAIRASAELGVWMVNVHAQGGQAMMEGAVNVLSHYQTKPHLIAVTILTSMKGSDLQQLGYTEPLDVLVKRLAILSKEAGLDGVVCSAREAHLLRSLLGEESLLVTPGIRMQGDAAGDQSRIMTPSKAIHDGANYLVIGRPITQHKQPARKVEQIIASLG
ncbi:MAG: orotidine-5'-phosphate decarboxylase [bacterium]